MSALPSTKETRLHFESRESGDVGESFRNAMRGFASTVTLVTARDRSGKWHGMAATAFSSVSLNPTTCLTCVNRAASIYGTLVDVKTFCVNLMHQRNRETMTAYTKPEFRSERFKEDGWSVGPNGAPFQANAQSSIFCRLLSCQTVGSHDVILAQVSDVYDNGEFDPLVYYEGTYRRTL